MSGAALRLPSKLLQRLDADIARSVHSVEQGCLRAERAGYFARQGYSEEARSEIRDLHALFYERPHPAVSASLAMAEGLLAFHEGGDRDARDKFMRAQALSAAADLPHLAAHALAWLAHTDYVALDFPALVDHARRALDLADVDQHAALARVCLVIANALHFASRLDLAQPWYTRARDHANAHGDDAMLSALNTDMASQLCDHALRASLFGGAVNDAARRALASANSAESFEQWVGTASLSAWVPMLRAVALSVAGQPQEALVLYRAHLHQAEQQGLARLASTYLADMAWCEWRVGHNEAAMQRALAAEDRIASTAHTDDLAVAHARLAQVFDALSEEERAANHAAQSRKCWAQHQAVQQEVVERLGGWIVP
jgi:hypothetical protein